MVFSFIFTIDWQDISDRQKFIFLFIPHKLYQFNKYKNFSIS